MKLTMEDYRSTHIPAVTGSPGIREQISEEAEELSSCKSDHRLDEEGVY